MASQFRPDDGAAVVTIALFMDDDFLVRLAALSFVRFITIPIALHLILSSHLPSWMALVVLLASLLLFGRAGQQ